MTEFVRIVSIGFLLIVLSGMAYASFMAGVHKRQREHENREFIAEYKS